MKPLQCRYCRRNLIHPSRDKARTHEVSATRDHVIPKSRGGTTTDWCCLRCNHLKADMPLIAWAKFMQAYPEWWRRFLTHGQVKTELHNVRMRAARGPRFPFHVGRAPLCRGLAA